MTIVATESNNQTPSLYQWAGEAAAIRRLMDCFYDRVEEDDLLSPYFGIALWLAPRKLGEPVEYFRAISCSAIR